MVRRLFMSAAIAAVVLLCPALLSAQDHVVRDIDISVSLSAGGHAHVHEVWNISAGRGTEWYLTRYNLGDITIRDLTVSENGRMFENEGRWEVDRSMEEKAFRCGILDKPDEGGCEICWGLGSYGNHIFEVDYTMTDAVKSMDDYDCLHIQFVSRGISPYPEHARVRVTADSLQFDSVHTAIWAFGFEGTADFSDGAILVNTEKPFDSDFESVILLARFDKGLFSPLTSEPGPFSDKLDKAFEGSDYKAYVEEQRRDRNKLIGFFSAFAIFMGGAMWTSVRRRNKNMFGVMKLKDIGYSREVPFGGNLFASRYVLQKCGRMTSEANMASALILKMIKDGLLYVSNDASGKVLISFSQQPDLERLGGAERDFYQMLYDASGEDHVLQEKEFSRWSSKMANSKTVGRWVGGLTGEGAAFLQQNGFVDSREFSASGKAQACNVIGFKKFLEDFTLSGERGSSEVALWQDYLIFASLYGIAKKVAREMKDIDPKAFKETFGYEYVAMNRVLLISDNMGRSVVNSVARVQSRSSVAGHGGASSFGGGGGFHGGGFGGGAR